MLIEKTERWKVKRKRGDKDGRCNKRRGKESKKKGKNKNTRDRIDKSYRGIVDWAYPFLLFDVKNDYQNETTSS